MRGADAIVNALRLEGVEFVAGLGGFDLSRGAGGETPEETAYVSLDGSERRLCQGGRGAGRTSAKGHEARRIAGGH